MRNKYQNYFIALIVIQLFIFISCTSNNDYYIPEGDWLNSYVYNSLPVGIYTEKGKLSYNHTGTEKEPIKCKKNIIQGTGRYNFASMFEKRIVDTISDSLTILLPISSNEEFTYKWSGALLTENNKYHYSFLFRFGHDREKLSEEHKRYDLIYFSWEPESKFKYKNSEIHINWAKEYTKAIVKSPFTLCSCITDNDTYTALVTTYHPASTDSIYDYGYRKLHSLLYMENQNIQLLDSNNNVVAEIKNENSTIQNTYYLYTSEVDERSEELRIIIGMISTELRLFEKIARESVYKSPNIPLNSLFKFL